MPQNSENNALLYNNFDEKKEGNIFTSLKDLTSSNAQFRDQNCCSSLRKLLCFFFVCLFVFFILSQIISVCIFSQYPFISFPALGRYLLCPHPNSCENVTCPTSV